MQVVWFILGFLLGALSLMLFTCLVVAKWADEKESEMWRK